MFPSEDEIFESYLLGEISYEQYLILKDFAELKIDSTTIYLLDYIPNLTFFGLNLNRVETEFEKEQSNGFLKPSTVRNGFIQTKYSMYLDETEESRYQHRIKYNHKNLLKIDFKLNKEYSGRERITYRQVSFSDNNSILNEFVIGNFSKRFGLGTAIGYRGKLLDYSNQIDGESIIFPDYGGQNGIYSRFVKNNYGLELLQSIGRDSEHSLNTSALYLHRKEKSISGGIIFIYNRLKNRLSDFNIKDYKSTLTFDWKHNKANTSIEITRQSGFKSSSSVIGEGFNNFHFGKIRYAGWVYGSNFLDFSGGSKYGNISNSIEIDSVDYSFSNKRSGQKGGILKTTFDLNKNFIWSNSVLYVSRNSDSLNFQLLTEFSKYINANTIISFDFLQDRKKRGLEDTITKRQTRLVLRYLKDKFYLRTYLSYNIKTSEDNYSSFFVNSKWQSKSFLKWELWFNLGRFNLNNYTVDYWYAYLKNEFTFSSHLSGYFKAAFRYNRNSTETHRNSITFELNYYL